MCQWLCRCGFRQGIDTVVFVGDLVNKGKHHVEVRPSVNGPYTFNTSRSASAQIFSIPQAVRCSPYQVVFLACLLSCLCLYICPHLSLGCYLGSVHMQRVPSDISHAGCAPGEGDRRHHSARQP
jgi:hypothetical protein